MYEQQTTSRKKNRNEIDADFLQLKAVGLSTGGIGVDGGGTGTI